mgnify:CR=1 FL=1
MSAQSDGFDALRITDLLHGDRTTPLGFVVTPAGASEPVRRVDTDDDDEDDDEDDDDDDDFDDDDLDDDEDAPEDEDGDTHEEGGGD